MLVKVNAGKSETYININLDEVAQVVVSRSDEAGHGLVRGGYSFVELKDGKQYLTEPDEAQRIVDAMRKRDDAGGSRS
jgi:hypothetical protein